jgi:predicted aspartyl protease
MAFSYFYESISFNNKNSCRRPVVPIIINSHGFTALIDSGSDSIVIPKEIAEALQISEQDKIEIIQMDGSCIDCKLSEVELEFGKGYEQYKFKSKAIIANTPRIILGRKGFFNHFKITFDELGEIVHFKSNSDGLKNQLYKHNSIS